MSQPPSNIEIFSPCKNKQTFTLEREEREKREK